MLVTHVLIESHGGTSAVSLVESGERRYRKAIIVTRTALSAGLA